MFKVNNSAVFLHVPKCAGSWAVAAMQRAGLEVAQHGDQHGHWRGDLFTFTLIRRPDEWLRSRWSMGRFSDALSPLWCQTFGATISAVTKRPGVIGEYFERYTDCCDTVGLVDRLPLELGAILSVADCDFNDDLLISYPKVNVSKGLPHLSDGQRRDILSSERELVERYWPELLTQLEMA